MQSAPIPDDEAQRLAELLSYDILDTEAEALFDEITALASQICESPIALISLIDPDRQWFKSKVGLDANETSRQIAFCAHAILQNEVFEVSDTHNDPRFEDNPLVTGSPNIRSYAGAPLITPSGHAIGTLCAISDEPHKLTDLQKQALTTLSHSVVAQLELRRKNRELERASQFKSDFLSYVSHEVRTPLNAINTFSRLLEEEAHTAKMPAMFRQSLGHIRQSGERLLDIVNSVLDVKQIEAGKMKLLPRPVSTDNFFVHLFSLIRVRAQECGIHFQTHIDDSLPEVIELDDTKFGQVALNILTNAIKYTRTGNHVRTQITFRDNRLKLVVKDEGIGISDEDQKRLFQPFERMDNASQFDGTGLGLMITRKLVELMNGTIRLVSQLNEGTTVVVEVPVKTLHNTTLVNESGPAFAQQLDIRPGASVLIVEDNEINQAVIKALLDKLQVPHTIVDSGEACLILLQNTLPDLILMDLNLPGISGKDTTLQIKKQYPSLPVVALTADVIADNNALLALGMEAVLTKPVETADLVRTLNTYLNHEQ
ncbi:ATP-binding protein [Alteromonas sp. H39]|uniref:GAF domain-containing hybrid sensor histidine kinase/response regulator n=1 Tax=Alteromonas sp. H39 TaxID=3389876 RepID=UPI0039E1CC50